MANDGGNEIFVRALQNYETRSNLCWAHNIAGVDHCAIGSSNTLAIHQCPVFWSLRQAKFNCFFGVKLTRYIRELTDKGRHTIEVRHFRPYLWSVSIVTLNTSGQGTASVVKVECMDCEVLIAIDRKMEVSHCL